ncbi:MAG: helix-turn-helix transcriptional regulator [Micropruina sp.]|nr:helix-turn-helix transcriptional regulator [Micropruina sp.]
MPEVMKERRAALALSQADLAAAVGLDKRQIRRYEMGEAQPTLPVAKALAQALEISIDELAGVGEQSVHITGEWWSAWQTYKDGAEIHTRQPIQIMQRGKDLDIRSLERGTDVADGGYLWRGQLRLWDNEILMGWYAADDAAIRSKGTLYLVLHQHGQRMEGRWVGLSYDGPIQTGAAAFARSAQDAPELLANLVQR